MAIIKNQNPTENPTSILDYQAQNRFIKNCHRDSNLYATINTEVLGEEYGSLIFHRGNYFDYNGSMIVLQSDSIAQYDISTQKSVLYLIFNGINFSFTGDPPTNFWDESKNGYYNENVKYIGLAVIQYYKDENHKATIDGVCTIQNASHGQRYVQYPKCPPPEYFFWGKWKDISSEYAGDFFRVEGGDASVFDSGKQQQQIELHNHKVYGNYSVAGTSDFQIPTAASPENLFINDGRFPDTYPGNVGAIGNETRPFNQSIKIYMCTNERS